MNSNKDLIVLTADKDAKEALEALLPRNDSLSIRSITYDIFSHPLHDPGVYKAASDFLRVFSSQYHYCLVVFDHEGSGQEESPASNLVETIKGKLKQNGWENRSEVIVLKPELEIWIWVDSLHTAHAIGWENYHDLKNWLVKRGWWEKDSLKPEKPKEAFREALKEKRIPPSSSIFREIGEKVSFQRCADPSFEKLRQTLKKWFPKNIELREV